MTLNILNILFAGKKMASASTVSFQFRSQLDLLLQTLKVTNPHYIKCIKPNRLKQQGIFDKSMVLEQLKYSGALEVVRIRQEGCVCLLYCFHSVISLNPFVTDFQYAFLLSSFTENSVYFV